MICNVASTVTLACLRHLFEVEDVSRVSAVSLGNQFQSKGQLKMACQLISCDHGTTCPIRYEQNYFYIRHRN